MPVKKINPGMWLFKEEPSHFSYADLEKEGSTIWSGVKNSLARQNLRKVQRGDRILYYHTGKERAIVGEMQATSGPQAGASPDDPKAVAIKVKAVRRWATPLTLDIVKKDPLLKTWDLVRLPRLSVMAVSPEQWRRLEELAGRP